MELFQGKPTDFNVDHGYYINWRNNGSSIKIILEAPMEYTILLDHVQLEER